MTPSINRVLDEIRHSLNEEDVTAYGPESQREPTRHAKGKPGEGGAENETNVIDALDAYLGSLADRLQNIGKSESEAWSIIRGAASKMASDGTLPSLPSDSSSDDDIALWLGKAGTVGFAQAVFQHGREKN